MKCEICGELEDNHGGKHHEFSSDGQLVQTKSSAKKGVGQRPVEEEAGTSDSIAGDEGPVEHPGPPAPEMAPGPFPADPVLRMALIMKGVISPDDLATAEQIIAASSGQSIASVVLKRSLGSSEGVKDDKLPTTRRKRKGTEN